MQQLLQLSSHHHQKQGRLIIRVFAPIKVSWFGFEGSNNFIIPTRVIDRLHMSQQLYHLADFSSAYKTIEKDKKKKDLKTLEFILEINKSIGFDEILARQGFEAYSSKADIEAKRAEAAYLTFFKYLKDNLNSIESNYLRDSNDLKLIEEAQATDQHEYNFLLNKNSVSKFVRDQAAHFQSVSDKYLQAINQGEEQKGVKTGNMHAFMIDLFTSKYTTIIRNNQQYLKRNSSEIQADIGNHLLEYAKKAREIPEEQAHQEFYIAEEEILDFLTFWLKEESNIFILYARTQERLNQQAKFITNQSHLASIVHPSRMTAQEIVEKEEQIELVKQEQLAKSKEEQQPALAIDNIEKVEFQPGIPEQITLNLKTDKQQQNFTQRRQSEGAAVHAKPQIPKDVLLKAELKALFQYGCKRRYKHNKNTTFEDIKQQTETMDLQKFINFCTFFELTQFVNKELITEYFKMFAVNLRTLDFPRFQKTIIKLSKADERITDNLLKRSAFQTKLRQHHIRNNKKAAGGLSSYKFMLRPINGKDVSTIEKELSFRRLEKLIVRQQKQKKAYSKREEGEKQKQQPKLVKAPSRVTQNYSTSKITPTELQPIRDIAFNPEKLISNTDKDKLWDAYEAKIWSKDQRSHSTLQSILSRRIERGNIVINKLNSQRSFIYDQ